MNKIYNKVKFITGILVIVFSIMVAGLSIIKECIGQSNDFIEKVYTVDLTDINKFIIKSMIVIFLMLLINMIDDNEKTDFFGIKYKQTKQNS